MSEKLIVAAECTKDTLKLTGPLEAKDPDLVFHEDLGIVIVDASGDEMDFFLEHDAPNCLMFRRIDEMRTVPTTDFARKLEETVKEKFPHVVFRIIEV